MATKLNTFDYDLVENYYLENLASNSFWLFASHAFEDDRPFTRNTKQAAREVFEKTVFAMKYEVQDFSFMIQTRLWQQNTVYVQYDDTVVLSDRPFYVVTEPESESGDYHVFKCISNNGGSISTEIPSFNESLQDGLYYLSDGYVWKYMTSIPFVLFRKFAARGLIPVIRNQSVESIADEGIYNIVIENPGENSGYERITGIINAVNIQNGLTRIFIRNVLSETNNAIPVFEVPNTFSNRSLYVEKSSFGQGIGAIELHILSSGVSGGVPFVDVSTPQNFIFEPDDRLEILPRVLIEGDGQGASAIAVFDSSNQRIQSIQMLSFGDNYMSAVARIVDPVSFDPSNVSRRDIRCIIRPILSPSGGHGSNAISELHSRHICLSKLVKSDITNDVVTVGNYSKVSLAKNPEFTEGFDSSSFDNRIAIELDTIPANIQPGSIVTQGAVRAKVHEIVESENKLFLAEYLGPYSDIFDQSEPLRFENINYQINSIDFSPYTQRSGTILSVVDFTPIERDGTKSEQIRLILDF